MVPSISLKCDLQVSRVWPWPWTTYFILVVVDNQDKISVLLQIKGALLCSCCCQSKLSLSTLLKPILILSQGDLFLYGTETMICRGKHKMISKLATQSFHILRLIARNPNFSRPKVPYFNVSQLSRQSRLHEVICIYVFRHTSLFMPLYRNIFLYMGIYAYCLWIWKSESMMNQLTNWHG